jgi:hypothetical protein
MKPIMAGGAQITRLGEELSSPTGNGARLERQGVTLKILAAIGGIAGVAASAALASQSLAASHPTNLAAVLTASPVATRAANPATTRAAGPATNPAATPATCPAASPATNPAASPATNPAASPATCPAASPATCPAASPATNPATSPAASDASGGGALVVAASPMADIADLYAWASGSNLNLVMDISALDLGGSGFDPSIIYVFHLTSKPGRYAPGAAAGTETQVRCRFASNTSVECWAIAIDPVGGAVAETKDYVVGDPRNPVGVVSARGKLRVFAGRRSNPASFNQAGFASAVTAIKAVPAMPQPDPAGCPHPDAFDVGRALGVRSAMQNGSDAFAGTNVMAIVAQIDKALVNDGGNTLVAVWASTHAGS